MSNKKKRTGSKKGTGPAVIEEAAPEQQAAEHALLVEQIHETAGGVDLAEGDTRSQAQRVLGEAAAKAGADLAVPIDKEVAAGVELSSGLPYSELEADGSGEALPEFDGTEVREAAGVNLAEGDNRSQEQRQADIEKATGTRVGTNEVYEPGAKAAAEAAPTWAVVPRTPLLTNRDTGDESAAAEAEAALRAMKLYQAGRKVGFWTLNAAWSIGWAYVAMWLAHWLGWLPMPWS